MELKAKSSHLLSQPFNLLLHLWCGSLFYFWTTLVEAPFILNWILTFLVLYFSYQTYQNIGLCPKIEEKKYKLRPLIYVGSEWTKYLTNVFALEILKFGEKKEKRTKPSLEGFYVNPNEQKLSLLFKNFFLSLKVILKRNGCWVRRIS